MPLDLPAIADGSGTFLRREAIRLGADDDHLARLVRGGALVRIRHGIYALGDRWSEADLVQRHLMLLGAVLRLYDDRVAASHTSSALQHGGSSWGLPLDDVHLTHFWGTGRKQSRIVHHRGNCLVGDITRLDGHWLTAPGRCVMETATLVTPEPALALANSLLHQEKTSLAELAMYKDAMTEWPNTLGHHVVLHLADPRIESIGESRTLYLLWNQGLPAPEPQWKVYRPDGRVAGRADFALPRHRLLIEFDGAIKYHRYRRPGETIEQMVIREKRREDLLRELTGWTVIRLTWSDLERPEATAARIRRAMSAAA